jgi:hypothetical protein
MLTPRMIRNLIPLLLTGAIAAVAACVFYFRPNLRPREKGGPPETLLSGDPNFSSHETG